jgi:outer membrane protein OmpA-like peptidoglycan-associated protein
MIRHVAFRGAACAIALAWALPLAAQRASGTRLTPVGRRISDDAVAHDLAVFAGLSRRAERASQGAAGTRRYLAERATQWIRLGQEAYERNDRTAFPEDMIVLAERDLEVLERGGAVPAEVVASSALFPNNVRLLGEDSWGRALALRADADRVGAPDEIARAEALLLRSGHPLLAGPTCSADGEVVNQVAGMLSAVERTRVTPTPVPPPEPAPDTSKQVVPPRPAPVPADTALPPGRRPGACGAPERLTGVASSVHFALDRAELAPATRQVLDRTIEQLKTYPTVRVRLSGHTDPRASDGYNRALSQRRVDAVTAYLTRNGIGPDRILRADAEGEGRLLASGDDPRTQARNRRVELLYVLCDGSELAPDETLDDLQLEGSRRREKEK